jgi:hypothetical protein
VSFLAIVSLRTTPLQMQDSVKACILNFGRKEFLNLTTLNLAGLTRRLYDFFGSPFLSSLVLFPQLADFPSPSSKAHNSSPISSSSDALLRVTAGDPLSKVDSKGRSIKHKEMESLSK